MRYRKRPLEVEAARIIKIEDDQVSFDSDAEWLGEAMNKGIGDIGGLWVLNGGLRIGTLEGTLRVDAGDYVVKGVHGEIYPVKAEVFKDTYDPA